MPSVTLELSPQAESVLRERAYQKRMTLEQWLQKAAEREAEGGLTYLEESMWKLRTRTPEQILADRAKALRTARPGLPLPEGKTLNDVMEGSWPGDETDEQIRVALEELS